MWDVDAGPAKAPLLKCTAQWETVLEEAIRVLGPPLLALCKPIPQIPKPVRYERKFCGKNFAGRLDHHMMFIVEAKRVLQDPGLNKKLVYAFTPKMSTGTYQETYATSLLETDLSATGISLEEVVSLDAWRKEWQEQRALQVTEEDLERLLAAKITETLTNVLSPWLRFFSTRFTYEEN